MLRKAFWLRIVQALVVILFALVNLMATISISYSQTQGWSQPVPLSSQEPSSWFPDVVADATGQVHVVWSSSVGTVDKDQPPTDGYDVVMYSTSQDAQEWSEPMDIAALPQIGGSEATRPSALIDRQGVFHLNFRYTNVYYTHAPAASISSANFQLSPRRVSTTGIAYFSRLALDKQNRLHLVLTQMVSDEANDECLACYHVFYRRSDDGGLSWSAPTDISVLPTGSAKPQIVIDGQDHIHVVWEAGLGGSYGNVLDPTKVMYAASYDGGETWTFPVEFVAPNGRARNIAIGLDGEDKLLVAWLGLPEHIVYSQFSRDHGRSWSPPQSIPGVWGGSSAYESLHDDYAMATDSGGNVHLVLVGRTAEEQESVSVLHLSWDGSSWSKPEAITTLEAGVPEWPRISVNLGNQLHVAWYVRDEAHIWDTDHGRYQIWYAHGVSSAPAVTPVAWPTPVATPEPEIIITPASTPTPTQPPTPTPTLAPNLIQVPIPPGITDSIYTEMDDLVLLVKSLVPAALVIIAVVIGVRTWRR